MKRTQVQKFVTDNLLTIAKHQNLNQRYLKFMSLDLEDEVKKSTFKRYHIEAKKKTRMGEQFIETVLDEARRNAKLTSDEMFIANRMKEIVTKSDVRVQDIVESHNKTYKHLDILFKKSASELKRPKSIEVRDDSEMPEDEDGPQVSHPLISKLRAKSAFSVKNKYEEKRR